MTAAAPSLPDFDPRSQAYLSDPQSAVQPLFETAPVFYYSPRNAYFVLPYDEVRRVLGDSDTYSSHAYKGVPVRSELRERIPEEWERVGEVIQGGQAINMDPPAHSGQRRAMQRAFTPKRVEVVKPALAAIAIELIDELADRGGCDLMQEFAAKLTARVVGSLMNVPEDLIAGFQNWILDAFAVIAPIDLEPEDVTIPDDQLAATYERLYAAYLAFSAFVEERRANPGDDLASAMLALTDEDGRPALSTDQVLAHMVGVTVAGTDSTANLIVNMVRLFTEYPDQLELVRADPSLWDNAIHEGLRRSALSLHMFRVSTRESDVAGITLPARSNLCVSIASANADPQMFPDPLHFDVRRSNAREHLAFGRGRHFCLGAPLAPPETQIALELLYERLPNLKADLEQELEFVPALTARRITTQRVSWSVG